METIKINRKSDLKLYVDIGDKYGGEPFCLTFSIRNSITAGYVCSYDGTSYINCHRADSTHILCLLDNHMLPSGIMMYEIQFLVPDPQMPDGDYRHVSKAPLILTNSNGDSVLLELTDGKSEIEYIPDAVVNALAPIMKGDPFRYEDFTSEQIAELQRPAAEAAEKATAAANKAEEAAYNAIQASKDAEWIKAAYVEGLFIFDKKDGSYNDENIFDIINY